ncbi:2-oxo acid dehydrogenase subunit E2 [Streptomyces sp. NPDC102467]|uniref:2-oxo acid dehydrogenase subunit E2 n=1 Tax=Streptomyces sp. NPDC102467 TaxID=3366179 RepID=UPI00380B688C
MADIRMPKLNNNDDSYVLLDWLVADGQPVCAHDDVATVETSKATEDLVSEDEGVLRHLLPAGAQCKPGDVIARVVLPGAEPAGAAPAAAADAPARPGPVLTAPARALLDELGIDPAATASLDVRVVRRDDVERLAATLAAKPAPGAADPRLQTLPAGQQAVARTVARAHSTIPAAYTVIRLDVGEVVARARELTAQWRRLVGVPEFLVAATAQLWERFAPCFASPVDDRTIRLADGAHIGVTIDIGNGLFVPVVHAAHELGLEEVAAAMGGLRDKAVRGGFREQDLSGGALTLTLHTDPDVTVAVPVVFPGQVCSLALGGTRAELVPDGDGFRVAEVAHLGLAYDHRVINGRDAVQFLRAVKENVERMGTESQ